MTRRTGLFSFFGFFANFGVMILFPEYITVRDWALIVWFAVAFWCFFTGIWGLIFSYMYKWLFVHDPEYRTLFISGFCGIFGFLIWKEFHPKEPLAKNS